MLSKKLLKKSKIYAVCLSSKKIKPGDSFRRAYFDEEEFDFDIPKNTEIVACGKIDKDEMLFKSKDGRYYFSIVGGWGYKDDTLYGIEEGAFFDFKHPTEQNTIEEECKKNLGNRGTWGAAMAYAYRQDIFSKILKVIKK